MEKCSACNEWVSDDEVWTDEDGEPICVWCHAEDLYESEPYYEIV